jgi:hypothetical protein
MEDHAARIDHASEPRRHRSAKAGFDLDQAVGVRHRCRVPLRCDLLSQRLDHAVVAEIADEGHVSRLVD